jgi:hypothetical protein
MDLRKRRAKEVEDPVEEKPKKIQREHRKGKSAPESETGGVDNVYTKQDDSDVTVEGYGPGLKTVCVNVGFGARAKMNSDGEKEFYMNPSKGANSETQHFKVDAEVIDKDIDSEALGPIIRQALLKMKYPVEYNQSSHTIMLPHATSCKLDPYSTAPLYHKLEDISDSWSWPGNTLSIIVVPKV